MRTTTSGGRLLPESGSAHVLPWVRRVNLVCQGVMTCTPQPESERGDDEQSQAPGARTLEVVVTQAEVSLCRVGGHGERASPSHTTEHAARLTNAMKNCTRLDHRFHWLARHTSSSCIMNGLHPSKARLLRRDNTTDGGSSPSSAPNNASSVAMRTRDTSASCARPNC